MSIPSQNQRSRVPRSSACAAAAVLAGLLCAWPGVAARSEERTYTLTQCIDLAVRQNPDVLAEAKRLDAAKAAVVQARAGVFPALSSTAYYQRREQSIASNGSEYPSYRPDDYQADIRLSQNLFSAGAVRSRIAIAEMRLRAEALTYQAQINTVSRDVRSAFYQTLAATALIGVRQQAIDLLGAQVVDQQDRLTAGSVAQINVNRAQVSLANERPALAQARYQLRVSYVLLSQLLAIPYPENAPEVPYRLQGELGYQPLTWSLDDCLRQADAGRPEIEVRKLAVDAAKRQITVEKSATRPQLSAFAAYDIYSEPDIRATSQNFSGYTVGVSANWQIFDGFATLGKVRSARAAVGVAEAALASMRLQVEAEVRTAFYDMQQAIETIKPEADTIRLAKENLDLTTRNFDTGVSSQLEVLQSRVDLTRARTTELTGQETYNTAMARLLRAVGVSHFEKSPGSSALSHGGK